LLSDRHRAHLGLISRQRLTGRIAKNDFYQKGAEIIGTVVNKNARRFAESDAGSQLSIALLINIEGRLFTVVSEAFPVEI
jgi:hypothetical protein